MFRRGVWLVLLAVGAALALTARFAGDFLNPSDRDPDDDVPRIVLGSASEAEGEEYLSSDSCLACHPRQHASWHRTYHRTMTQRATPEAVVAPGDRIELAARGRKYEWERRGREYWVTMPDPGREAERAGTPPLVSRKVVLTTGSHHLQTYWIASIDGQDRKLMQFPWYYHIAESKWIPAEDSFLQPDTGRHRPEVWNHSCINCHAVAGVPGVDGQTGFTDSRVAELGIACEACHGPGKRHVLFHQRIDGESTARQADPIFHPGKADHKAASEVCAQCHSNFVPTDPDDWRRNGYRYRPGSELTQFRRLLLAEDPATASSSYLAQGYWPDGTNCVGGDEYHGLVASACFQRGTLSCLSCHSMHQSDPDDQLREGMRGNQACLGCHQTYRDDISEHTRHAPDSSGSLCYNCHMPHTSYALFSALRSHRIDVPRVERGLPAGRPNACNLCHLDQTLAWTASRLAEWHGHPHVDLSVEEQTVAASLLWLLKGDARQRVIAAWSMGWSDALGASGNDWQAPYLGHLLEDSYAAVRFVAFRSLRELPGFENMEYDFVGPADHRSTARQAVLDGWRNSPRQRKRPRSSALLIDEHGAIDQTAVEALLNGRDDREISIPE